MNEYGLDYMNYITSIPQKNAYNPKIVTGMNYVPNQHATMNLMNQNQILEPYQGWIKGNLFANLYDPYKNYKPVEVNPNNEKEALLYQLMQYQFVLIDLDLYLDTHPNDQEAINLYHKYLTIKKQMCDKYESMYGAITLDSNYLGTNSWTWKNSPWPWEGV